MKFNSHNEAFDYVAEHNPNLPFRCSVLSSTRPGVWYDAEITKIGNGLCLSAVEPNKLAQDIGAA